MTPSPKERRESGLDFSAQDAQAWAMRWVMASRRREAEKGKDNRVRMMRLRARAAFAEYRTLDAIQRSVEPLRSAA